MPVDSSHAYGLGPIFPEQKTFVRGKLLQLFSKWIEKNRAALVWDAFRKNSVLGRDCFLGPNAWCVNLGEKEDIRLGSKVYCRGLLRCGGRGRGRIVIGDEVYIGDNTIIGSINSIEIGSLTMISHGVHVFDNNGHPTDPMLRERDWKMVMEQSCENRPEVKSAPVKIGSRVWIGFNSIIMKGVQIGDNAIVAAGSVVVENVAPNTVVAGNPAREIKII